MENSITVRQKFWLIYFLQAEDKSESEEEC